MTVWFATCRKCGKVVPARLAEYHDAWQSLCKECYKKVKEKDAPALSARKGKTTFFHGDRAEYTGKTEILYGGLFHEIRLLEGHLKGELRLEARNHG